MDGVSDPVPRGPTLVDSRPRSGSADGRGGFPICPWCHWALGDPVTAPGSCPRCGLVLSGAAADGLAAVDRQLFTLSVEEYERRQRWDQLMDERSRLAAQATFGPSAATFGPSVPFMPSRPPPPRPLPAPPFGRPSFAPPPGIVPAPRGGWRAPTPRPETRPITLRTLLLALGAGLIGVAALVFVTVAWPRLDDLSRLAVLVGATAVSAALAGGLRRRLNATSETFAVLFIGFCVVDWYAVRHAAGDGAVSGAVWWAIGTAIIAAVSALLAILMRFATLRVAAAGLAIASGTCVVAAVASTSPAYAFGAALIVVAATAGALALDRPGWRPAAITLLVGAIGGHLYAGLAAVYALATPSGASNHQPVAVQAGLVLILALLPAGSRTSPRAKAPTPAAILTAGIVVPALGALVVLGELVSTAEPLLAWAAAVGGIAVIVGRTTRGATRHGTIVGAVPYLAIPALVALSVVASTALLPFSWFTSPWTGELMTAARPATGAYPDATIGWVAIVTLGTLIAAAVAAASSPRLWRTPPLLPASAATVAGMAATVGVLLVLPVTLGASTLLVALTGTSIGIALLLGGASQFDRHYVSAATALALAGPMLVAAVASAAAERRATVAVLAAVAVAAGGAALVARRESIELTLVAAAEAAAIALVVVALLATRVAPAPAAFGGAAASAVAVAVGAHLRRARLADLAPAVGLVGIMIGSVLATADLAWAAGALTIAVPASAAAGIAAGHQMYRWAGAVAAVLAVWAWLMVGEVTTVEAYTLPPAALALAAGWLSRREPPTARWSWGAFGPALTIAMAPSLLLALGDGPPVRPIVLFGAAAVVVTLGASARLQAPLLLGSLVLAALAIDALWPVAAQVERWILLAVTGVVFIWLGATVEHRMRQLRHLRDGFGHLR